MIVHAQSISLRVGIGKEPALQHAVGREAQARYHGRWREGSLLHVRVVILRIAIENHLAHFNARIGLVRPDFGDVEWIDLRLRRLGFRLT